MVYGALVRAGVPCCCWVRNRVESSAQLSLLLSLGILEGGIARHSGLRETL